MLVDYLQLYRGRAVAIALVLVACFVLSLTLRDRVFGDEPKSLECMLLDVSRSTLAAHGRYSALARDVLRKQSERDANACYIVIKGAPAGESEVRMEYVGADNPGNSSDAPLERVDKQLRLAAEIEDQLKRPRPTVGGSALIEGLDIIASRVRPGDTIHMFSDGLQDSVNFVLRDLNKYDFSQAVVESSLAALDARGFIPNLAGVTVIFETPGYRPGAIPSVVSDPEARRFWQAWGDRARATVRWRAAE